MFKKIAFTMYPVIDLERARHFYEKILGLKVSKLSAEEKWVEYDLVGGGCFAITTLAKDVHPSSSSGGSVAFEVEDLAALMSLLKTKNVEVKLDMFPTPVCKMAVIIDSEGNSVILHQINNKND
jgi:predicted enzyme related to lactoylglutathione lyase